MKKIYFLLVALTLSIATMSLSSCEDDASSWNIFDAELIPGDPWLQDGYEINYLGGDEYEIYDVKKKLSHTEYLDPFASYESSVPEDLWPEKYKPYFDEVYSKICWYVYSRGSNSEFLILQSGAIRRK